MATDPYKVPGIEDTSIDHIVKAEAYDGKVRAMAVSTTAMCAEAQKIHNTSTAVTCALGRFMTGSLLISSDMKNETDTQTSIIKSDGPIGGMTCVCDFGYKVRAFPVNSVIDTEYHHPGKVNVGAAVGQGMLTVIRDIGLKEPYVGSVELISGEIAEDFAYYLAKSEQTKSVVALGVLCENGEVKHAGGLMVQLLPSADDKTIDILEQRAAGFPDITFLMSEGFTPAKIIDLFLGDPDVTYLSGSPVSFSCPCSKEKMSRGLITLGKEELTQLTDDPDGISTECQFCGSKYHFTKEDIEELIKSI